MATTASAESSSSHKATTAAAWGERALFAELPSGAGVFFRFPSLGEMIALGELPDELLEIAVAEWAKPGAGADKALEPFAELPEQPTDEQLEAANAAAREVGEKLAAINRHLMARALVEPKMSAEQLEAVPYTDLEYLARIVNRQEAFDAAGRRIGPEPIATFRVFAENHNCAADCPACAASRRDVSAVQ